MGEFGGCRRHRWRGGAAIAAAGAALLLSLCPARAFAQCPDIAGQRLVYVDIYDGPPSDMADLVPDQHQSPATRTAWNVWQLAAGPQGLYVKCGYGKALAGPYTRMETVRLPDATKTCRADFTTGRRPADLTLVRFSCR